MWVGSPTCRAWAKWEPSRTRRLLTSWATASRYQAQVPGNQLPQPPPFYRWTGPRTRYYAPSALVSGNFVHSDEFMKLALNPGGGSGGTCFGDSGGPDLLGGTDTVLAVNSYVTNVNCSGVGYSMRVDTPDVLAWINSFLP